MDFYEHFCAWLVLFTECQHQHDTTTFSIGFTKYFFIFMCGWFYSWNANVSSTTRLIQPPRSDNGACQSSNRLSVNIKRWRSHVKCRHDTNKWYLDWPNICTYIHLIMYFHSRVKRGGLLDPKKQTVKELPAMTSVLSVGTCLLCHNMS